MSQGTSELTREQWLERLHAWAVERWGQTRADAIRGELDATAQHLLTVAEYSLEMEQVPGFFFGEV